MKFTGTFSLKALLNSVKNGVFNPFEKIFQKLAPILRSAGSFFEFLTIAFREIKFQSRLSVNEPSLLCSTKLLNLLELRRLSFSISLCRVISLELHTIPLMAGSSSKFVITVSSQRHLPSLLINRYGGMSTLKLPRIFANKGAVIATSSG